MTDSTTEKDIAAVDTTQTPATQPVADEVMYCANHPNVETRLRCNRCGKPICLKCAKLTDVGYRCPECIRSVQDSYFNAKSSDNIIAFGTAAIVTAIASPIASILFRIFPFFFISIIIAIMVGGTAGGILSQIIRRAVSKRRSRQMRYYSLAGIITGILIGIGVTSVILSIPLGVFFSIPMAILAVLATSSTYQLLR